MRHDGVTRLTRDQLSIYLHDHLAADTFGAELARRASRQNRGGPYGEFLEGLVTEIEEDRVQLEAFIQRLGTGRDQLKTAVAWTGEKLGRLKLNGRLTGYAPLSRVIELEGLLAGVEGKRALWSALREIAEDEPALDPDVLDGLIARAERQLEGLRDQHVLAAREAFRRG
jgi:hypothetical protein